MHRMVVKRSQQDGFGGAAAAAADQSCFNMMTVAVCMHDQQFSANNYFTSSASAIYMLKMRVRGAIARLAPIHVLCCAQHHAPGGSAERCCRMLNSHRYIRASPCEPGSPPAPALLCTAQLQRGTQAYSGPFACVICVRYRRKSALEQRIISFQRH
jgi:hypothetical protein